jgi:uncharacterized membrane protein required for colicin V production
MTLLDWAILIVAAGLTLSGFWKGAVKIVFGIGGFVAGVWLALVAGSGLEQAFTALMPPGWIAIVLARLLPLVVCVSLCWLAGWGLEKTLKALRLGWLNHVAGAALAGFVGLLVLAVVVVVGSRYSPAFARLSQRSLLPGQLVGMLDGVAAPESNGGDAETLTDEGADSEPGASDRAP